MRRELLALLCGVVLGLFIGLARSDAELAALDRDRAVLESQLWACERVVIADLDEAQDRVAAQCAVAAEACSTVAESAVAVERVARGLLWVAPGPRVDR
jgi:hypothetical protein